MTRDAESMLAAMRAHVAAFEALPTPTGGGYGRTCMTYWFPKLVAAGVPVPRTDVIDAGDDWREMLNLIELPSRFPAEHARAERVAAPVVAGVRAAADRLGYPAFLRTGHTSGKHAWAYTCHLPGPDAVLDRVVGLLNFSGIVDLSYRVWVVREMLPVEPVARLSRYDGMPLVKEVRAFVRGGRVACAHPYWPLRAVRDGLGTAEGHRAAALLAAIDLTPEDYLAWSPVAARVAEAFAGDGAWSVDLLATRDGWYVTDMAEAERSYHEPGCVAG